MKDTAALVKEFGDNIVAQTNALRANDVPAGNKHARRYVKAFEMLRAFGDEGRDALLPLLSKETRPDVRLVAATVLLRHRHDEASQVLLEMSRGVGLVAFEAGQALKRWDDGSWQLDPADDQ